MTTSIRTIRLEGEAGERFGKEFKLAVRNAREAFHALGEMIDGFRAYMMTAGDRGVEFFVSVDGEIIPKEALLDPSTGEIVLTPALAGSKNSGGIMAIVGAVLVVVGIFLIWTPFGAPLMYAGIGLMVAGICMMLSPQPKDPKSQDDALNKPNYAYQGAVNTQAQGNPVPILYGGPMYIGSAVISASIALADNVSVPVSNNTPRVGGGGGGTWNRTNQA